MFNKHRFSLVKPGINTQFHIDFDWWKAQDNNWRIFLLDCLCQTHRETFSNIDDDIWIDWVDSDSAEVHRVDGLQHVLMTHCARQPEFVTSNTSLVDAVFRAFLANGNAPLTPVELSAIVSKPPETILRTFTGPTIYKGIRPCQR